MCSYYVAVEFSTSSYEYKNVISLFKMPCEFTSRLCLDVLSYNDAIKGNITTSIG